MKIQILAFGLALSLIAGGGAVILLNDEAQNSEPEIESFTVNQVDCLESQPNQTSTTLSQPVVFNSIITTDSHNYELTRRVVSEGDGTYRVHINTTNKTTQTSQESNCEKSYGVRYQIGINIPRDGDPFRVILYHNGEYNACAQTGYDSKCRDAVE